MIGCGVPRLTTRIAGLETFLWDPNVHRSPRVVPHCEPTIEGSNQLVIEPVRPFNTQRVNRSRDETQVEYEIRGEAHTIMRYRKGMVKGMIAMHANHR